jgi:magnesium-transporting ATPase (P-type)
MSLRNTEFVLGLVVFTGHDTKVMKNSAAAKYKFSRLELLSNQSIAIIFVIQCALALFAALIGANFLFDANHSHHGDPNCKNDISSQAC